MYEHPWRQSGALWVLLCGAYVAIFGLYWLGNLAHLVMDMRSLIEARLDSPRPPPHALSCGQSCVSCKVPPATVMLACERLRSQYSTLSFPEARGDNSMPGSTLQIRSAPDPHPIASSCLVRTPTRNPTTLPITRM